MNPQTKTIVVKIGTSSLTQANGQMAIATIASLVETLTTLRQRGYGVVLVSSGAVGVGCLRLNLAERPRKIALKQAVAAVGQGRLMRIYDDLFSSLSQPIAQVLLTRRDLVERNAYVNVSNTFEELLNLGVIPIVNENDTVAIDELKFGDNDSKSSSRVCSGPTKKCYRFRCGDWILPRHRRRPGPDEPVLPALRQRRPHDRGDLGLRRTRREPCQCCRPVTGALPAAAHADGREPEGSREWHRWQTATTTATAPQEPAEHFQPPEAGGGDTLQHGHTAPSDLFGSVGDSGRSSHKHSASLERCCRYARCRFLPTAQHPVLAT